MIKAMPREQRRTRIRRLIRFGLQGVAIGLTIPAFVFFFTVEDETWEKLSLFHWSYLPLLLGMVGTAWLTNGLRTFILARALGHPLRYRRALGITLSMEFAIGATPGGVGGPITRLTFMKQAGIPITTGTSIMAADVAADLLFFLVLLPFGLLILLRDQLWVRIGPYLDLSLISWIGAVLALFATGWCLLFLTRSGRRQVARFLDRIPGGRRRRLRAHYRGAVWRAGRSWKRIRAVTFFLFARRRWSLIASFLLAVIQISCRYGVLPVLLLAFGVPENPLLLILLQGIIFALQLAVVVPGGGGAVEIVSLAILPLFAPLSIIALLVVFWRFFTFHLYLLAGGVAFYRNVRRIEESGHRKDLEQIEAEVDERQQGRRSGSGIEEMREILSEDRPPSSAGSAGKGPAGLPGQDTNRESARAS